MAKSNPYRREVEVDLAKDSERTRSRICEVELNLVADAHIVNI